MVHVSLCVSFIESNWCFMFREMQRSIFTHTSNHFRNLKVCCANSVDLCLTFELVSKILPFSFFRSVRISWHWGLYFATETFQLGDFCWFSWTGGWRYEVSLWRGPSYPVARCVCRMFINTDHAMLLLSRLLSLFVFIAVYIKCTSTRRIVNGFLGYAFYVLAEVLL